MRRSYILIVAVVAVLLVGGIIGAWLTSRTRHFPFSYGHIPANAADTELASGPVTFQTGFEPVAKRVLPAVVNIASSKVIRSAGEAPESSFFSDPLFRRFFGNNSQREFQIPREQRERSLGSGVIVANDGYILTNNHVVEGADQVKISLADTRELDARVVGTDPKSDLAVVKINAKDLPVVSFGDSDHVHVGDFAVAVGNPFGVGETMTMGIISATGRSGLGIEDYEDFIQTDAAINPGNSGGALVDVNGNLIGVNTAIVTGGGSGNQGVGFAIPANMARRVMEEIEKHGKVVRGWLGVSIQPVTPDIASAFHLTGTPRGALVGDVTPQSPADTSGIRKGDIILAINGDTVRDSRQLALRISELSPGASVRLHILRDGKEMDQTMVLGEAPPAGVSSNAPAQSGSGAAPKLGISVVPLTPDLARQLNLPGQTSGAVISEVDPGSPAEEAGLQRGDVIQEVNRQTVRKPEDVEQALSSSGSGPLLLLIDRSGNHIFVTVHQARG